jgi:hypothetical protein
MRRRILRGFAACAALCAAGLLAQACSTGCDSDTIDEAVAFIKAHQTCQTNDDCVVIHDFCDQIPGGWCGQLAMNRTGAESSRWRSLSEDMLECTPSSCSTCDGLFTTGCSDGVCRQP